MTYQVKVCAKCGKEFVASGLGCAVQRTCDMCSEGGKWEKKVERVERGTK